MGIIKSKKFRIISLLGMFLLAAVLVACGGNDDNNNDNNNNNNDNEQNENNNNNDNAGNNNNGNDNEDNETAGLELGQTELSVPYVAWAREEISTHILAALLEEVGYEVETLQVEAGPMFTSVADGDTDFHTSAWLPATHEEYWDDYGDDLVKVNEMIDKAPLALAVPDYVEDVDSMEDLKDNTDFGDSVDWEIIGIDGGAGIMSNTEKALEEYELDDWTLVQSSEAAMLTELQEAIENEEPIIVPLWEPHWIFGAVDVELKMLEDPKEIYGGDGDQIYTVARKDLEEDAPAAYHILEQYEESYDMLNELMPLVHDEGQDPADVAQQFLDDNPDLVEEWTEGIN